MPDAYDGAVHPYPVAAERASDPGKRRAAAKVAAHTRWAHEDDRRAATQAARDGLQRKFEDQVDPGRELDPVEREKRVANAKSAYYTRLAAKSAASRGKRGKR